MREDKPVIERVVADMLPLYSCAETNQPNSVGPLVPHRRRVVEALDQLLDALLPAGLLPSCGSTDLLQVYLLERIARAFRLLTVEIGSGLSLRWQGAYAQHLAGKGLVSAEPIAPERIALVAADLTARFVATLPAVRARLIDDIQAAYDGDPAAISFAEVMLTYPGLWAIAGYRLAHELHLLDVPVVPRIITEHIHSQVGIDIHPGARIGSGFFIDHGTGVVIGETARVGDRVKLYQGVTLGARSFPLDERGFPQKGIRRHPTVEDDVVIYANATILGDITIGAGSEIGGNVFLTEGVPPGSLVLAQNEVTVRHRRVEGGGGGR